MENIDPTKGSLPTPLLSAKDGECEIWGQDVERGIKSLGVSGSPSNSTPPKHSPIAVLFQGSSKYREVWSKPSSNVPYWAQLQSDQGRDGAERAEGHVF